MAVTDVSTDDVAALARLFDDYRVHHGHPAAGDATVSWLADQLRAGALGAALAWIDGQAVGLVTWTVIPASLTLRTAWLIRDVYVDPAGRRRGVARALLDHVVAAARAGGAVRVSLQTEPDNAAALALYESAGFERVTGLMSLSLPLEA